MFETLQVFGERNSGTNFVRKLILKNTSLKRAGDNNHAFGWKHGDLGQQWCIYDDDNQRQCDKPLDYHLKSGKTLFVVVHRGPIEWIASMHNMPHHAPQLYKLPLAKFINQPWRSYWGKIGQDLNPDRATRLSIVSDDREFENYDSVFALRKEKIRAFQGFVNKVDNVCFLRYEDVFSNSPWVLESVAKHYDLKLKKSLATIDEDKFGFGKYAPKLYPPIPGLTLGAIIRRLDWDEEQHLGYELKAEFKHISLTDRFKSFDPRSIIETGRPFIRCASKGEVKQYDL